MSSFSRSAQVRTHGPFTGIHFLVFYWNFVVLNVVSWQKPDASSFLLGLVNDFLVEYHVVVIYKRTLQPILRTLVITCHILTILYVTET